MKGINEDRYERNNNQERKSRESGESSGTINVQKTGESIDCPLSRNPQPSYKGVDLSARQLCRHLATAYTVSALKRGHPKGQDSSHSKLNLFLMLDGPACRKNLPPHFARINSNAPFGMLNSGNKLTCIHDFILFPFRCAFLLLPLNQLPYKSGNVLGKFSRSLTPTSQYAFKNSPFPAGDDYLVVD